MVGSEAPKRGEQSRTQEKSGKDFLTVGIGASAGGVQALKEFFAKMPPESGMAFAVVLHLSQTHESSLPEILARETKMPVIQVTEAVKVEPNHVYVIPPAKGLEMIDGVVRLTKPPQRSRGARVVIDRFFRTLADAYGASAVGIVMSGTGEDGTLGIKQIKEANGFAIVQDPNDAEHDQMPRSAMETGLVDWVLPVEQMPEKLLSLRKSSEDLRLTEAHDGEIAPELNDLGSLREILAVLRIRTGHDFSNYKYPTMLRRIARHLQIHELENMQEYVTLLRERPEEVEFLLANLLISVTNFFRNPEAFDVLESDVVPRMFAGKTANDQIRVWVPACATGEEAYSIAMLLCEYASRFEDVPKIQIFASDVDEDAIAFAREGLYGETSCVQDISPARLRRFFNKEGSSYRVKKSLREMILFAPHNILRDPPFSKLDFVSCRNLLIYLNREAQERVMSVFHFSLLPNGFLFVGSSESAESLPLLFTPYDKKQRIYLRRPTNPIDHATLALPLHDRWLQERSPATEAPNGAHGRAVSFNELHFRMLEKYAPPSLVVNEDYEIVHLTENVGRYLQFVGGEPTSSLLRVVHPALRPDLRAALFAAKQDNKTSETRPIQLDIAGEKCFVNVRVQPVDAPDAGGAFMLVIFEESESVKNAPLAESELTALKFDGANQAMEVIVRRLEEELRRTKDRLRANIEQHETSVEELKASNEELMSMNEELRSATEELETSREELQSVNEELNTVNYELKDRIEEATRINSDLQNLMSSTDIGTIFLDRELRIKRYTPNVREIFNVIQTDIGRPLEHLTHRLDYNNFAEDAKQVLRNLRVIEREVHGEIGQHFIARLLPYRTIEDKIDGVVMAFVDITERKRAEEAVRRSEARQTYLLKLGDALRPLADPLEIQRTAMRVLGEHLQADRVLYSEIEADDRHYVTADNYARENVPKMTGRFPLSEFDNAQQSQRRGETLVLSDIRSAGESDEQAAFLAVGVQALIGVPLHKDGRWVASLSVHHGSPREWSSEETALVGETAERTWAAVERARAEASLAASEEKYRTLFDSIDEGFCLIEMIYDERGETIDYRFLDVNRVFERQTGLAGAAGKRVSEIVPQTESAWLEAYGAVARTGEAARFEIYTEFNRSWYQVHAARVGGADSRQVGVVFDDITGRKRREANLAFLAEVSKDLVRLTNIDETMSLLCAKIGGHFNAARVVFAEIGEDETKSVIRHEWRQDGLPTLKEAAELKRLLVSKLESAQRDGEISYIKDVAAELRDAELNLTALGIAAILGAPIVRDEKLHLYLGILDSAPREWRADEIELMRELTARIRTRLENARAEEALRESEENYRTLFTSIDEAFCAVEVLFDEKGKAFDYRFLETNPAFERQTGLTNTVGKTALEVVPQLEKFWFETYGQIAKTGEAKRFEHEAVAMKKIYDVYAFRIGEPTENRVAIIFNDISKRKQSEQELKRTNELLQTMFDSSIQYVQLFKAVRNEAGDIVDFEWRLTNKQMNDRWGERAGKRLLAENPAVVETGLFDKFKQVTETGVPDTHEHYYAHEQFDGWFLQSIAKVEDGFLLSTLDITERKQAEAAKIFLASIVESSKDSIITINFDRKITSWNRAAEDLYGYPAAEALGKPLTMLTLPEDLKEILSNVEKIKHSEQVEIFDTIRMNKDGREMNLEIVLSPVKDAAGQVIGVSTVARDVTERRLAEESTRFQSHLLDTVEQSVIATDLDGVVIYWNQFAERLFGWKAEEAKGRNILELTTPKMMADQAKEVMSQLGQGKSWSGEFSVQRRDGTTFPAQVFNSPIADDNGTLIGVVGISVDITERKQAEQALLESEERLRLIMDSAEDYAITTLDAEGRFTAWNTGAEKMFGYSAKEVLGQHGGIIFTPEDRANSEHLKELETARREGSAADERYHLHKDGTRFYVSGVMMKLQGGNQRFSFAKIARDLSERQQMEETLREGDRRKDEFLATLAHELRNPLAPIRTALEIMRRGNDKEKGQQAREIIERQTNQLVHLVDDLLDISRITQDKIKLRKEHINIADSISAAVETVQPFIETMRHRLDVRLPDAAVFVEADRTRLTQIVLNLLHNSAKYTEPGGHILLIAAREGDEAVIRVRDNGIGIQFEMLPAIFDIFAQTVTGEKRGQGGLGIGLSLVKKLVEMHGGRVEADSEGEGKGSEFIVRLPLAAKQKPEKKQAKQETEKPRIPIKAGRILVVDDNTDAANMLEIFLSMENHEVRTAFTGHDAIQAAAEFKPDTVILDIGLPDIDGYEVAKRLRERLPDICLIALSGWGQDEDRRRSNEAGFNHHLVKPVNIEELKKFLCL